MVNYWSESVGVQMTVYESGLGVWVGGKTVSEIYYIIADFNGRMNLSWQETKFKETLLL